LKGGVDVEGGRGCHDAFLLGLAVSRRLPGKKVRSARHFFPKL
jgi:hypothetical protein